MTSVGSQIKILVGLVKINIQVIMILIVVDFLEEIQVVVEEGMIEVALIIEIA